MSYLVILGEQICFRYFKLKFILHTQKVGPNSLLGNIFNKLNLTHVPEVLQKFMDCLLQAVHKLMLQQKAHGNVHYEKTTYMFQNCFIQIF